LGDFHIFIIRTSLLFTSSAYDAVMTRVVVKIVVILLSDKLIPSYEKFELQTSTVSTARGCGRGRLEMTGVTGSIECVKH